MSGVTKAGARAWLQETWLEIRQGPLGQRQAYFAGAVDVLAGVGLLSSKEADAWIGRSKRCPGHEDEGGMSRWLLTREGEPYGRIWCAYGCHLPAAGEVLEVAS